MFFNEYRHKLSVYGSAQHTDRNSYYGADKNANAYGKTKDLTAVGGAMYVGNMDDCLFRLPRLLEELNTIIIRCMM